MNANLHPLNVTSSEEIKGGMSCVIQLNVA